MGTRWNRLCEAVLTNTHNLCFEQKYEKYQNFYLKTFSYLVVKFSIYLNRRVFVRKTKNGSMANSEDHEYCDQIEKRIDLG